MRRNNALHSKFQKISDLRNALLQRMISAIEIAESALSAIEKAQHLNSFIQIDPKLTLLQAKKVDSSIKSGKPGPLAGVPIAHKDMFVTKGWKTTAGSKILENYISPFNATIVDKLEKAGAICFGKLNCDEFGMGSKNMTSAYGSVLNPWDHGAEPGGSSGGSGAAVAAGLVYGATATDTGGSVRLPASMCGVSGIRPTYGTVSRFGMIAFASSLDQAGVIAPSSLDLLEFLDVISGFDKKDPTSLKHCNSVPNKQGRIRADFQNFHSAISSSSKKPLQGIRIGIPMEYFSRDISTDVLNAIENAILQFEKLGAKRVRISLPYTKSSISAYYIIASAEASSNLARYDGIRYGYRTPNYRDLEEMISKSRSEAFGKEVKRRILMGTYVLSREYYGKFYLKAKDLRSMLIKDFKDAFSNSCDAIMCPVAPCVAKDFCEESDNPTQNWLMDICTLGASLAGLPAMSIPCGFGGINKKKPIGLQIIGDTFQEGSLLALANFYQNVTDWHNQVPNKG